MLPVVCCFAVSLLRFYKILKILFFGLKFEVDVFSVAVPSLAVQFVPSTHHRCGISRVHYPVILSSLLHECNSRSTVVQYCNFHRMFHTCYSSPLSRLMSLEAENWTCEAHEVWTSSWRCLTAKLILAMHALLIEYLAGVAGGIVVVLVGHPFDTTKTRLQTSPYGFYSGTIDCVKKTWRREGVGGFYSGEY